MQPDLELVHIRKGESFAAWMHGYPFRTVRWHYHPEYEIHLVTATSGTFYIGDHVGSFGPGQLIMTGPNLPQNWISDLAPGEALTASGFDKQQHFTQPPARYTEASLVRAMEEKALASIGLTREE